MRFIKQFLSGILMLCLVQTASAVSLYQGAWVKNTDSYKYGHHSINNIPVINAPSDTDWSRWAMLHDGKHYRLYAGKKGVKTSLYQFAYNPKRKAYQLGYKSIRELTITNAPRDARFYDFAMLHDGKDYRLYLKSKSVPNRLYQFAWKKGTNQYEYGHRSIATLNMKGFPSDTNWARWQMLHDGRDYRVYFGKGKSNRFYQGAFNPQSNRYEYGFKSISTVKMTDFPSQKMRARTAMLHDGSDYRFYGLSLDKRKTKPASPTKTASKPKPTSNWVSARSGHIPNRAVQGGQEANGEKLYVCRARFNNGVHIGKVSSTLKACNFGWGGREQRAQSYEVLTY